MKTALKKLLFELGEFGRSNDKRIAARAQRMLNITRDTGESLALLVRATNAQRVLEIGTSNGYSTLWLADSDFRTSLVPVGKGEYLATRSMPIYSAGSYLFGGCHGE